MTSQDHTIKAMETRIATLKQENKKRKKRIKKLQARVAVLEATLETVNATRSRTAAPSYRRSDVETIKPYTRHRSNTMGDMLSGIPIFDRIDDALNMRKDPLEIGLEVAVDVIAAIASTALKPPIVF